MDAPYTCSEFKYTFSPAIMLASLARSSREMFRNVLMSTSDAFLLFDAGIGQVSREPYPKMHCIEN